MFDKKNKNRYLIIVFVFQFFLIAAMFFNAYSVVFFGKEVQVFAKGYDPRDILAGNYVRLDYDVRLPDGKDFFEMLDKGNFYFAVFKEKENTKGIYDIQIEKEKPKTDLYIQALGDDHTYLTLPNIERYFLPQKEAQELEKKLSSNKFIARVTLKVWRGKARIVHLDLEKNVLNEMD